MRTAQEGKLDQAAIQAIEAITRKGVGYRAEIESTKEGVRVFELRRKSAYKTPPPLDRDS